MHGCYCGKPGELVERRNLKLITREWIVVVEHEGNRRHVNHIVLHQPAKEYVGNE